MTSKLDKMRSRLDALKIKINCTPGNNSDLCAQYSILRKEFELAKSKANLLRIRAQENRLKNKAKTHFFALTEEEYKRLATIEQREAQLEAREAALAARQAQHAAYMAASKAQLIEERQRARRALVEGLPNAVVLNVLRDHENRVTLTQLTKFYSLTPAQVKRIIQLGE